MLSKGLFRKPKNRLEDGGNRPHIIVRPSVPERLYVKCGGCYTMLLSEELTTNGAICSHCGYHFRLFARNRIKLLCDKGSFAEHDRTLHGNDPIHFPGYPQKLAKAAAASGEQEAVITGRATIGGQPCALFVMDPAFMMGSMGTAVGEKITRLFEYATEKGLPVIGCTSSGGARMQEGILSLMQMAKTSGAVGRHSQAGNLYIALLTDPTTGGVTASFAMQADIILAEPGALIAFAGPTVIEQTIKQKLPSGFQRAEFLLKKGFIDAIVPRTEQRDTLSRLLALHTPAEVRA